MKPFERRISFNNSIKWNFNRTIFSPHKRIIPTSEEELVDELLKAATHDVSNISVVGAFSSFTFPQSQVAADPTNDCTDEPETCTSCVQLGSSLAAHNLVHQPSHIVIDMSAMNKVLRINPSDKLVTVEAGMSWQSLVDYLKEYNLAVYNLSAYPQVTIAGAAGTGTHGSGTKILADQFVSMKVVDARGNLQHVTDSRLFTHLGVLGIVTSVTIRCVPLFYIKQSCFAFPQWSALKDILVEQIHRRLARTIFEEHFSLMVRISLNDNDHDAVCFTRKVVASPDDDSHDATFLGDGTLISEPFTRSYGGIVTEEKTSFTGCYDEVLTDHSTSLKARTEGYFQAEYFIPFADAFKAIDVFLLESEKDEAFKTVIPSGCKLRFVIGDDHHMSPCGMLPSDHREHNVDTPIFVALQLSLYGRRAGVDAILERTERAFERVSVPFTAHWGKLTFGGHAHINRGYKECGRASVFDQTRREWDPDNCLIWPDSELGKIFKL